VDLKYNVEETYPSPDGMPAYENSDWKSPSTFFVHHSEMQSADKPDFTGTRVSEYARRLKLANTLKDIKQAFVTEPESAKFFPKTLNFRDMCKQSTQLFTAALSFQRQAVLKWNPHADEVTETLILGMNPLDEAASMETGAIVLKLLSDFSLIELNDDGSWVSGDLNKFVFFFGDLKTVDNINLIQDNIRKSMNGKGFTQLAKQLDVFDKALNRVLDLPGDWHAGLSMLSSIYLLFYDALLEPIQKMLKWQRINKETRKCYYQSGRLVMLVNQVLTKVMLEGFIGSEMESLKDDYKLLIATTGSNDTIDDFICYVAQRFEKFLLDGVKCDDEWRRLCCVFLIMSSDWISFVQSYRKCDSIAVELIYERFAPVWRCLGQSRYLERVWRQQESLLRHCKLLVGIDFLVHTTVPPGRVRTQRTRSWSFLILTTRDFPNRVLKPPLWIEAATLECLRKQS
jgi:hypothetical protein